MSDAGSDEEFPPLGTYEGARNRRKERNGEGLAVLPNKDRYKGQYYRGKRYGKGKYTYANKLDEYDGDYVVNQKHGFGVFLYKDGTSYHGMWSNNKYHGHGVYLYINNDWYAGQWKNGIKEGKGLYYYAETAIQLRGDWVNGQFVKGDWLFADGMYTGSFKDGQPIGQGVFYYKSGVCQRGSFVKKGKSRVWVVDSYDRINPDDVEIAVVEKKTEIRDTYIKLFTEPLFSESKKESVYAQFQKLGAQGEETEVSFLDLIDELVILCGDAWSIHTSFLHEVIDSLPLPPRDESSMVSFKTFWEATQSKEDVVETFKDQVYKDERKQETIAALSSLPLDEDGGVILNQALQVLVGLSTSWGYNLEAVSAQLSQVEPFVDVASTSQEAEPINHEELWTRLKTVHIDVTHNVKVGVFEPEPEPEPEATGQGAGDAFVLDQTQREALSAAAQLDEDGNISLGTLRQILSDLSTEWFKEDEEQQGKFQTFVDGLPWFKAEMDEEDKAATLIQFTEFLASFGTGAEGGAAAGTGEGNEDGGADEEDE